jgi:hypothetical protein
MTHDFNKPFAKVIATKEKPEGSDSEDHFNHPQLLGTRNFSGLEAFMIMHPNKAASTMAHEQMEDMLNYADHMESWDKFTQCFTI